MRTILYTGKGDVGKTDVAAATSLRVVDPSLDDRWGIESPGESVATRRRTAFVRGPF